MSQKNENTIFPSGEIKMPNDWFLLNYRKTPVSCQLTPVLQIVIAVGVGCRFLAQGVSKSFARSSLRALLIGRG